MKKIDDSKDGVLRRFMQEFFPFSQFKKIGLFTPEMKGDYDSQAAAVCGFFGYKTVFEYGAHSYRVHITYAEGKRPKDEPFVKEVKSIYE